MSRQILWHSLALLALGTASAWMPLAAQDAPSVAEAAKRARQQKESSKPVKVITNDEIPSAPAPAPAPAQAAPGNADAATPATTPAETKKSAEENAEEEAQKKAKIEALQRQIHDLERDVNIQKGAIRLDEETYYSNPNRPRNTDEKNKIDREKQDLQRMESDLQDLKSQLEALGVEIPAKPPKPRESITSNAPPQS
jgi:hypothetical protein